MSSMSSQLDPELLNGYRRMAADREREADAQEWCEGLIHDATLDQAVNLSAISLRRARRPFRAIGA